MQLLNAWLVVMESAHQRLLDLDLDLGVAHLPKLFSCIVDCFMANAPFVKKTAASLLEVRGGEQVFFISLYKLLFSVSFLYTHWNKENFEEVEQPFV